MGVRPRLQLQTTAPAFILLVDQMGWSVSSCLTRTVRRVQIQLQVSKIYLVSYLSVINVCVWEAGRAPPRPAHSHHCRGHGWDPTWRSIPTSARFWEGVSSDTILLSRRTLGRGDGWWGVIQIQCKYPFQVPHFNPPWQSEILTAAAQNDKINKNSWTVDQKMINWQFLFFGKFYLIYFINTGEKVQIDNGTPGFGFQVTAGRTHKKWGKLITILSFLISFFMWTFLSLKLQIFSNIIYFLILYILYFYKYWNIQNNKKLNLHKSTYYGSISFVSHNI